MDKEGLKKILNGLKPDLKMPMKKGAYGRILSVDLGKGFVKIAQLSRHGKSLELLDYAIAPISASGNRNAETEAFIKGFIQKKGVAEHGVYLTVSDPDFVFIRTLLLPVLSYDETLQAAKWQLKEDIPFDMEKAIINWEVVKELEDDGVKKNEVICLVAQREFIDGCISIVTGCGLPILDISTPLVNYGNILNSLHTAPQISAVLDVGHNETVVCVYRDNIPYFIRNLAFSSERVTKSLTEALVSDKGRIQLSVEQAEDLKRIVGIPADEQAVLKYDIKGIQVISLLRPLLEGLARELKLSFNYFSSNFKEDQPSALFIAGGGANLKNLDAYLSKEFGAQVRKLPFPESISPGGLDKEALEISWNQIIGTVGACMPGPRAISLLPQEIKAREKELVQRAFLRVASFIVGAVLTFSLFVFVLQIRDYKKRLANARIHLQTIQKIRVLKDDIKVLDDFASRLQNGKVPVYGLLKQLSAIMPGNVILNQITLDQARHSLNLTGDVSASGSAVEDIITDFMAKMEKSPFLTETALVSSEDTGTTQKFEIKADLAR